MNNLGRKGLSIKHYDVSIISAEHWDSIYQMWASSHADKENEVLNKGMRMELRSQKKIRKRHVGVDTLLVCWGLDKPEAHL